MYSTPKYTFEAVTNRPNLKWHIVRLVTRQHFMVSRNWLVYAKSFKILNAKIPVNGSKANAATFNFCWIELTRRSFSELPLEFSRMFGNVNHGVSMAWSVKVRANWGSSSSRPIKTLFYDENKLCNDFDLDIVHFLLSTTVIIYVLVSKSRFNNFADWLIYFSTWHWLSTIHCHIGLYALLSGNFQ